LDELELVEQQSVGGGGGGGGGGDDDDSSVLYYTLLYFALYCSTTERKQFWSDSVSTLLIDLSAHHLEVDTPYAQ